MYTPAPLLFKDIKKRISHTCLVKTNIHGLKRCITNNNKPPIARQVFLASFFNIEKIKRKNYRRRDKSLQGLE